MESSESYNTSNFSMTTKVASYKNSLLIQINTLPKSSEIKFLSKPFQLEIPDPQQYYYSEQKLMAKECSRSVSFKFQ